MIVRSRCRSLVLAAGFAAALPAVALWAAADDQPDLRAITLLKQEAFQNSKVMDMVRDLSDRYGPALTGSANMRASAEYIQKRMTEFGFENVHLEKWRFGRGWSNQRFYAQMTAPLPYPLIGGPKAFTGSTKGLVTGEVVLYDVKNPADEAKYKGKLKGKFILLPLPDFNFQRPNRPTGHFTDANLADLFKYRPPAAPQRPQPEPTAEQMRQMRQWEHERSKKWLDEGVLGVIEGSFVGDYGTFIAAGEGSWEPGEPEDIAQVVLAAEHYGRLFRLLKQGVPVSLEMNVENKFDESSLDALNVVGEIRGTDKADEVVMLGGHYDAIHLGTGATDDLVGCATMIEAARLIKASGLKPRRTIRVGCWAGEEQGLLGSRAYVQAHYADRSTMQVKPEHAKLSAYYNLDNGAGAIRGIYLQGNDAVAPIFTSWMEPFRNMGMSTYAMNVMRGTDNYSFDEVGLATFGFIQDPLDYGERTHHTNMDVFERVPAADTIGNSVIAASFAYNTANREGLIPRKPMPKPVPPPAGR